MKRIAGIVILLLALLSNAHAVPPVLNSAGQVTVNGEAFDGNGLFKFATPMVVASAKQAVNVLFMGLSSWLINQYLACFTNIE